MSAKTSECLDKMDWCTRKYLSCTMITMEPSSNQKSSCLARTAVTSSTGAVSGGVDIGGGGWGNKVSNVIPPLHGQINKFSRIILEEM